MIDVFHNFIFSLRSENNSQINICNIYTREISKSIWMNVRCINCINGIGF